MKRPEGFDRTAKPPVPPAKAAVKAAPKAPKPARVTPLASRPKTAPNIAQGTAESSSRRAVPKPSQVAPARESRAMLRRAARERKAYERGEVKRFTRRTRSRRRVIIGAVLAAVALVGGMVVAVFSPLLSLQEITIAGTNRIDPVALHDALDDQIGTPLALVDFGEITQELGRFPLVRSYTTESVPPHTLVITIQEREPIGLVNDGSTFAVIDPAGIVLESVAARPAGLPLIDTDDASIGNKGFNAAVEVLLALPPELLARVDTITATTKDDVGFSLIGGAQSVKWGSADNSATKAKVLAALVASQDQALALLFDVSAPDTPVVRSL